MRFRETLIWNPAFVVAVSGLRRGRTAWPAPVLLFAAVLLIAALAYNLANLDPTSGTPDLPDAGGTPPTEGGLALPLEVFHTAFATVAAVLIVATVYIILTDRRKGRIRLMPLNRWNLIGGLITILIFLAFVTVWPNVARNLQSPGTPGGEEPTPGDAGDVWPQAVSAGVGLSLVMATFVGIAVLVLVLRASPFRRARPPPEFSLPSRDAAVEAVQEAIREIDLGGDVRSAILGCYHRFCTLLQGKGLARQAPMTPREIEVAAVEELRVTRDAAGTLTSLFEEARYSLHPLGEDARARSLASLEAVCRSLEA